jgi:hypothetical protein
LRSDKPKLDIYAANNVYELRSTGSIVNYLQKYMFSPTKSAPPQAAKNGHLTAWPSLTEQAINKHLKMTPAMAVGHMNQRRQNIRATTKNKITSDLEAETVTPAGLGTKTHLVYAVVIDQGQLYTDLTYRACQIQKRQMVCRGLLLL